MKEETDILRDTYHDIILRKEQEACDELHEKDMEILRVRREIANDTQKNDYLMKKLTIYTQ